MFFSENGFFFKKKNKNQKSFFKTYNKIIFPFESHLNTELSYKSHDFVVENGFKGQIDDSKHSIKKMFGKNINQFKTI